MLFSPSRRMLLSGLAALPFGSLAQASALPSVIRLASPDFGSGDKKFPGANALAVLKANGWLEEEFRKDGVKIEWSLFRGAGPAINEALSAKQLDIVHLGDLAGVIGRSRGLATRLIAGGGRNSNSYLAVAPGSGIKSFADLKGRKVSVLKGTAFQRPFNRLLADAGLTERDIRVINMDWPTSKAAVVSQDIDATFGGTDLHLLLDKGVSLPVSTKRRGGAYTIQSGIIAAQDFLDQYPDATVRLLKQFVRAAHWASDEANREKLIQLYAEASGQPPLVFRAELEGEDLLARHSPRIDEDLISGYQAVVADALKQGLIRADVDVGAWAAPRYLNEALLQLKLQARWPDYDANGLAKGSPAKPGNEAPKAQEKAKAA